MNNSPLVTYTNITSHRTSPRNHAIDTITIHCFVGQVTAKQGCDYFATCPKDASSNYVVGKDGSIGLSVEEKDRSWCSSSRENDNRSITIETACDATAPWAVNSVAYNKLIELCTDICHRNGKTKMVWIGDKAKALAFNPAPTEMRMTCHRWFAATGCPGDYLYARMGEIAEKVNAMLGGTTPQPTSSVPYVVEVTRSDLNIRQGPGTNYAVVSVIAPGTYTIVSESAGQGATLWGKLKSGAGWISLDYAKKISTNTAVSPGAAAKDEKEQNDMTYYKTIKDVPSQYIDAVKKLVDKGALKGTGGGELNVSDDMCRILTILDRLGKLD